MTLQHWEQNIFCSTQDWNFNYLVSNISSDQPRCRWQNITKSLEEVSSWHTWRAKKIHSCNLSMLATTQWQSTSTDLGLWDLHPTSYAGQTMIWEKIIQSFTIPQKSSDTGKPGWRWLCIVYSQWFYICTITYVLGIRQINECFMWLTYWLG